MQKTRLAFVSLLSLLVVLAPVSTALAESEEAEDGFTQSARQQAKRNKSKQSSVFEEIEKQGGESVTEERLNKAKGELGPFAWAGVGALSGAASYGIELGLTDKSFSWGGLGTSVVAGSLSSVTGYSFGALTASAKEAAAAAGSVAGSAIGSTVASLSPWS